MIRRSVLRRPDAVDPDRGVGARRGRRALSTATLLLGALALTACAAQRSTTTGVGGATGGPAVQAAPAPQIGGVVEPGEIATVALLAPLRAEGRDPQALARALANAAELALRDMPTQTLRLQTYDTFGTEEGASDAARRAIADGADLIVGPVFSHAVAAARPIATEAGVTMVSFSNDPTVAGDGVFVLGFLVGDEIERVTRYATANGLFRLAAIAPDTRLGDVSLQAFDAAARAEGAQVVAIERYPLDFQGIDEAARRFSEINEAQLEPAQAVLIADRGQTLQSVASFLTYYNVSPEQTKFYGSGLWRSDVTLREVALQGGWFAAPDPRVTDQFAERYLAAFGEPPHPLASLGYDALAAAGALAADARARQDRLPFAPTALASPGGFIGVNGVFRFRPDGLNERGLAVLEVRPDGFAVIDPAPQSFVGN